MGGGAVDTTVNFHHKGPKGTKGPKEAKASAIQLQAKAKADLQG